MPDYQLSKVYAIRGGDEVYIGSSAQKYLSTRFEGHKRRYKCFKAGKTTHTTSFILFDKYGVENCFIELIETFPCNSVEELHKREGEHIRKAKNCVNKLIAGRNKKEYYKENKEEISEQQKEYREEHKEEISERNKEYREEHKEALKERNKEYYEEHKQEISDKKNVLHTCVCGLETTKSHKARHEKSKKHIAFINQNTITE